MSTATMEQKQTVWEEFLESDDRFSPLLDKCNFDAMLLELGGIGKNVRVETSYHGVCTIMVKKGTKKYDLAIQIMEKLENYPCLDEEAFCEMEADEEDYEDEDDEDEETE